MNLIVSIFYFSNVILLSTAFSAKIHLYEILAFSEQERQLLYTVYTKELNVAFLNGVTNEAAIPIIAATISDGKNAFEHYLAVNSIQFTRITLEKDFSPDQNSDREFTKNFHEWPAVTKRFDQMATQYSNIMKKIIIGHTSEHRDLIVFKISMAKDSNKRCAVFIMAGEEGRDWLSPAIALNLMHQFLQGNKQLNELAETFDFYFMPFFNPDGYQYSITNTILWAKNRKDFYPQKTCTDLDVIGVNVDRNWLVEPADFPTITCGGVNLGIESLSELETSSLAKFLSKIAPQTLALINVRGFMRLITFPNGNNCDVLFEILAAAVSELEKAFNVSYDFSYKDRILFNFTSCAADWVKQKLNVPLVYTIYMRQEDHLWPEETDIAPLTDELASLTKSLLEIAYEIYGPIVNSQITIKYCVCIVIALNTLLLLLIH